MKELLADLRSSENEMSLEIPETSSTPEGKSVELVLS